MPIMDGYEASVRINEYLSQSDPVYKTKLYALTADCSQTCADMISKYPFNRQLNHLDDKEIKQIYSQVDMSDRKSRKMSSDRQALNAVAEVDDDSISSGSQNEDEISQSNHSSELNHNSDLFEEVKAHNGANGQIKRIGDIIYRTENSSSDVNKKMKFS